MSHLAVAHCPVVQTNVLAAGMNKAVGVFGHQHIVNRRAGTFDGVGFVLGRIGIMAPAVADYQYVWFVFQCSFLFCHKTAAFPTKAI